MMVEDVPMNGSSEPTVEISAQNEVNLENFHITTPQEEMDVESLQPYPSLSISETTDIFEVARWHSCQPENYLRGCIFSPDGTCLLTAVNMDGIQVFELPLDLYDEKNVKESRVVSRLKPAVHVKEGPKSTVYDMKWYPLMNSHVPETCSFLISRQHEPIKSIDAFDGKIRCSYRGYDAVDEVEAALSLCYSPDGTQIYAGYKKTIKIFDTNRPGRDYETLESRIPSSALAVNEDNSLLATGSWNTSVSVFDIRSKDVAPRLVLQETHRGGITHLKFLSETTLISGARKDSKLVVWDLRNPNTPFFVFNRNIDTNQRIYFDVTPEGKWLLSGSTDGCLKIWNMFEIYADNKAPIKEFAYKLHDDCLNGISVHPFLPIVATSSGQHMPTLPELDSDAECSVENFVTMWWLK
ncbi:telomerase Cajal body protein 1 homolog [Culicoides brevitarsis]|uniref:telomerase Cajal body protein 1 homolog n=1 Tax=Culicoides brevitarsis TaxID=469753 RepID=UPI00307BF093